MPTASAVAMPSRKQGAPAPIAPHPLAFARLHGRPLVVHVAFEPSWLSQNPKGRAWMDALRAHPDLTLREDDGSPCDVLHYVGFDPSFVLRARHADRALVTFGLSDDPASVWRRFPPAVTRLWAKLVSEKDTAGNYILPYAGWAKPEPAMENHPGGGPIKPAGEILGYPVYTNRWMPAVGASSVNGFSDTTSNPCVVFGNMKAFAFGDKGEMRVGQFESGSFGGKEIALADQRGLVYKHRHALTLTLPRAMVVGTTSAS